MNDHDPVYRSCLESAKRDYRALEPQLQSMQRMLNALRNVINGISILLGEEVDEEFEYPYNKGHRHGRPSLRQRPAGRASEQAQHGK